MNKWLWLMIALMLSGCASQFQADLDAEVDASINIGQMQTIQSDAGVLYDWFVVNNAWNESEQSKIGGHYQEMIRVMDKLQKKAVAGQVDYHRLLYGVEDLTEAWQLLKPELQVHVDIVATGVRKEDLENRLAISMWNNLSADMDAILGSANSTLKNAEDGFDAATYAAFKKDAQGIIKTISPLIKVGFGGLSL